MNTRILLAPSADLARETLADEAVVVTVEAEYGSFVAEGRFYTAAHHQPAGTKYAGTHVGGSMRSPCNDVAIPVVDDHLVENGRPVVLVSHLDLDTFGGCLRAFGSAELFRPSFQEFWDLAEFVDTHGAHKLGESGASDGAIRALYAFWAWSKTATPRFPREVISDVTDTVRAAGDALTDILEIGDEKLYAAGEAFRAEEAELNRRTLVRREEAADQVGFGEVAVPVDDVAGEPKVPGSGLPG